MADPILARQACYLTAVFDETCSYTFLALQIDNLRNAMLSYKSFVKLSNV